MVSDEFASGFSYVLEKAGTSVKIGYFDNTIGSVYDNDQNLTQSGTDLWVSGVVMPMNNREGSEDSVLLEQGKLQNKDKRLYVNGSISMSNLNQTIKVQIGSPTGEIYSTIPIGAYTPEVSGEQIYKRQYLRLLQGGSF